MPTLDLTPTWAGLMPAFFAILESGTGEGPAIAKAELTRLAAWADSTIADNKAAKSNPPLYTEETAAQRGRGLSAIDLARAGQDFMAQGAYLRAACYWAAAARIAPAGMAERHDFRVSADLAEREAAALLSKSLESARREAAGIADSDLAAKQAAIAAAYVAATAPHSGAKSFAAIRAALAPFVSLPPLSMKGVTQ